jgi:hypothetical protein
MPVFTIPRKRKLKDEPEGCVIVYKGRSKTFDSPVICENFIGRSLAAYKCSKNYNKTLLVWDSARPHKTPQTLKKLKELDIDSILVPGRTTPFLQPADLMWFKELKRIYHEKWTSWWLNDRKAFTRNGNLKSPGYVKAMKWFMEAWNELDKDVIISSFEKTGITYSNPDNYNSVLKYVLENSTMPGSILEEEEDCDEINGFNCECHDSYDEEDSSFDSRDASVDDDDSSSQSDSSNGSVSESEKDSSSQSEIGSDVASSSYDEDYELYEGPKSSKKDTSKKSKSFYFYIKKLFRL